MIKDYRIASGMNEADLVKEVAGLLKRGYVPQGGVGLIPETRESTAWYAQAMVLVDGR